MALLLSSLSFLSSPLPPPPRHHQPPFYASASRSFSMQWQKNLVSRRGLFDGAKVSHPFAFRQTRSIMVQASEIDGADAIGPDASQSDEPKETVSVENLPLESKQQMILEQRMKMKLAKKIRLRRKRLLRKRRMRKKGRWPPSKMKKLKNV